jgi:hypothetical protein
VLLAITSCDQLSLKAARFDWRATPYAKCCAQCTNRQGRHAALLTAVNAGLCLPAQVTIWSRYVEALMAAGETDNVKTVFGRCLMQCPSVDLWFMYLKFIKKVGK